MVDQNRQCKSVHRPKNDDFVVYYSTRTKLLSKWRGNVATDYWWCPPSKADNGRHRTIQEDRVGRRHMLHWYIGKELRAATRGLHFVVCPISCSLIINQKSLARCPSRRVPGTAFGFSPAQSRTLLAHVLTVSAAPRQVERVEKVMAWEGRSSSSQARRSAQGRTSAYCCARSPRSEPLQYGLAWCRCKITPFRY